MKIRTLHIDFILGHMLLFYGSLDDGNYFIATHDPYVVIVDADTNDLNMALDIDWLAEHKVTDFEDDEAGRLEFIDELIDQAKKENSSDVITKDRIEAHRNYLKQPIPEWIKNGEYRE